MQILLWRLRSGQREEISDFPREIGELRGCTLGIRRERWLCIHTGLWGEKTIRQSQPTRLEATGVTQYTVSRRQWSPWYWEAQWCTRRKLSWDPLYPGASLMTGKKWGRSSAIRRVPLEAENRRQHFGWAWATCWRLGLCKPWTWPHGAKTSSTQCLTSYWKPET